MSDIIAVVLCVSTTVLVATLGKMLVFGPLHTPTALATAFALLVDMLCYLAFSVLKSYLRHLQIDTLRLLRHGE